MRGDAYDTLIGVGIGSAFDTKVGQGHRRIYIPRTEAAWNALTGKTLVEAWLMEAAASPTLGIVDGADRQLFDIGDAGLYGQGSPWAGEQGLELVSTGHQAAAGVTTFGEPSDDSFIMLHGHFPADTGGNPVFTSKHDVINHGWFLRNFGGVYRWQVQDTGGANNTQVDVAAPMDVVGSIIAGFSKTNGISYLAIKTNGRLYSASGDISSHGVIDNAGTFKTARSNIDYPVRYNVLAYFNGALTLAQAERLIARML